MPFHFWWRPGNAPVSRQGACINIGLDLGGDIDPTDSSLPFAMRILTWPAGGYIFLCEVEGTQNGRGAREGSGGRIIGVFHGTFHRDAAEPINQRITFEIETGAGQVLPHAGDVIGFNPGCIFGVDVLVLTLVNREFHVNLPFYIDTETEGDYLEIEAIARTPAMVLGRSDPLRLPIRRRHQVITTTPTGGRGHVQYTGQLIGNLICHHEKYLVWGRYRNRTGRTRRWSTFGLIEVPWQGESHAIPFEPYRQDSFKILLLNDIFDAAVPEADFFRSNIMGSPNGAQVANRVRMRLQQRIRSVLREIFEDAGFGTITVWLQNDQAAASTLQQFNRSFQHGGNGWTLRNSQQPFSLPFWTFIVAQQLPIAAHRRDIPTAGLAEATNLRHRTTQADTPNREYELPYPAPIGSGNKELVDPIFLHAEYFRFDIADRSYRSEGELNRRVDLIGAKFAVTIAHEIGHSLGLMHPAEVRPSGHYDESSATPLFTIMCSQVDSGAYGIGMRFSHQDKVIWERAFGVNPNWQVPGQQRGCHFRNRTWSNWRNTDWSERRGRMMRRHGESSAWVLDLTSQRTPPPYAGTGRRRQRGTHVP